MLCKLIIAIPIISRERLRYIKYSFSNNPIHRKQSIVIHFVFSFHFPFHSSHLEKKFLAQTLSRYFFIYLLSYAAVTKEYLFFTMKSIFSNIEYFEIRFYSLNNAIHNGIQNRSNTATIDNTNTTIIFNF